MTFEDIEFQNNKLFSWFFIDLLYLIYSMLFNVFFYFYLQ